MMTLVMPQQWATPHRQRAMALVIVLWFLALLTLMVGALAYSMRVETQTVSNAVVSARGRAVGEAAIFWAIAEMAKPEDERQVLEDGTPFEWEFGGAKVTITVLNEAGLVDINTASRELMAKLFTDLGGLEAEQVDALLDAITDFRDQDNVRSLNGAEDEDYEAQGLPGAKDAPFESVEELQRVMGMTGTLYRAVAPYMTVYSHSSGVNPRYSPRGLLLVFADGDAAAVDSWMAERAEAPNSAMPAFGQGMFAPSRRNSYRITADSGFPDGTGRIRVSATAFVYPQQQPPYVINAWREQVPGAGAVVDDQGIPSQ